MKTKKMLSVVLPIYNEENNIREVYSQLHDVFTNSLKQYNYEFIFVNDGSTDKSLDRILSIAKSKKHVKYIDLSRNFGKEIALTCGIHNANGDAVILMDSDLQHPVRLIPDFVRQWENEDTDIVIGIKKNYKEKNILKKIGSNLFYLISKFISPKNIIPHASDFRLLDKSVVKVFNTLTERNRITRGLIDWLGFKKTYIYFNINKRRTGKAKYSMYKLYKLAMRSFISNSLIPLKLAGYLGMFITLFSTLLGVYIFIDKYLYQNDLFSGIAIVVVFNLFLIGIVLVCLGLIALYVGSIHHEVIARPLYIIRKKNT